MAEGQFVRLFPGQEGYRFFLIDAPDVRTSDQARQLAEPREGSAAVRRRRGEHGRAARRVSPGGEHLPLDVPGARRARAAARDDRACHGDVPERLERRRELALLRAVGYDARHVTAMIGAETLFLLLSGLAAGAGCAIVAVAPAWLARGGSGPGMGSRPARRHRRGRDPVRRRRHARGGDWPAAGSAAGGVGLPWFAVRNPQSRGCRGSGRVRGVTPGDGQ